MLHWALGALDAKENAMRIFDDFCGFAEEFLRTFKMRILMILRGLFFNFQGFSSFYLILLCVSKDFLLSWRIF